MLSKIPTSWLPTNWIFISYFYFFTHLLIVWRLTPMRSATTTCFFPLLTNLRATFLNNAELFACLVKHINITEYFLVNRWYLNTVWISFYSVGPPGRVFPGYSVNGCSTHWIPGRVFTGYPIDGCSTHWYPGKELFQVYLSEFLVRTHWSFKFIFKIDIFQPLWASSVVFTL